MSSCENSLHFFLLYEGFGHPYEPRGWLYCVLHIVRFVNKIAQHIVHSLFGIEQ